MDTDEDAVALEPFSSPTGLYNGQINIPQVMKYQTSIYRFSRRDIGDGIGKLSSFLKTILRPKTESPLVDLSSEVVQSISDILLTV
ncbi:unnamed protein product [Acanthoscelides obtectus]|uniref:Uncharacterized protein n=1 Tax=Acanthoscelides obtectus TaxID=200917 RepID=A0A9P0KEP2_ACAOB|nr:unnamed protein product [Acanthoscelides obtectus]CAK1668813.1 hypothetical protein AOBTE_LOCUS26621 [Acanthoscelides obtectus]